MRETFDCPACSANDWESVAECHYTRNEPVGSTAPGRADYVSLRRRVLFEVWNPGADALKLTTVMCRACGFLTYHPRPTPEDIDAKYRMLQREEGNIGGRPDDTAGAADAARARRVFDAVVRHAPAGTLDVMDFGGGDGKLLLPFLAAGHRCALVDYNVSPLAGIEKVGDTLTDVPGDRRFDVVICSHVIEHLADPGEHVEAFRRFLRPGGVVYGEVPFGIWKGIGIEEDPVTHVNFFTTHAFGALFAERGYGVESLERRVGVYNHRLDVIVAIAAADPARAQPFPHDGPDEARRHLRPGLATQIGRRIRLRRYPSMASVRRRFSRLFG